MADFFKGLRLPQFKDKDEMLLTLDDDAQIIPSEVEEEEVDNRVIIPTTAPVTPKAGDIWYDTNNSRVMIYTGSRWIVENDDFLNVTQDYTGQALGDCFLVDGTTSLTSDNQTMLIRFHRDGGLGNAYLAINSWGPLPLYNPDNTPVLASDIHQNMVIQVYAHTYNNSTKAIAITPILSAEDSLTSTSTTKPLSANQGKILDEKISNIHPNADVVIYNNEGTELAATDVQSAITELDSRMGDVLTILKDINGYKDANEEVY